MNLVKKCLKSIECENSQQQLYVLTLNFEIPQVAYF